MKSENAVSVSGAAFCCTSSSESGFTEFWDFQDFVVEKFLDVSIHFSTKITSSTNLKLCLLRNYLQDYHPSSHPAFPHAPAVKFFTPAAVATQAFG